MIIRVPDWFTKLARKVGKNTFLKKMLHPFYYGLGNYLKNRRNRAFRKKGLSVIKDFDDCLTQNGYQYSLTFGSMLGAVREHGFIKHDLDFDVVMWAEDYSEEIYKNLKKYGFNLVHELLVDNGISGREDTYEKNGVSIDIFYIYKGSDKFENRDPYCCDYLACDGAISFDDSMKKYGRIIARRIHLPWKKEFVRVNFETLSLPVLSNSHDLLKKNYGDDYMIPNPQWSRMNVKNHVVVWTNANATYKSK